MGLLKVHVRGRWTGCRCDICFVNSNSRKEYLILTAMGGELQFLSHDYGKSMDPTGIYIVPTSG